MSIMDKLRGKKLDKLTIVVKLIQDGDQYTELSYLSIIDVFA
jgi:hypothetical protein